MDNKGQYLGHKADLSILLSLSVVEKTQVTQKKAKKYLGVAEILFQVISFIPVLKSQT